MKLEELLKEDRIIETSLDYKKKANLKSEEIYVKANEYPEKYWEEHAESLSWFKKWDKVLEWHPPFSKWFVGGKLNACYNCVDRHIENSLGEKVALLWEGENGSKKKNNLSGDI